MIPRDCHVVWPNASGSWSSGPLSSEQLNEYNQNGYLMLEGVFSEDEIEKYMKRTEDLQTKYQELISNQGDVRINDECKMVTEEGANKIRWNVF